MITKDDQKIKCVGCERELNREEFEGFGFFANSPMGFEGHPVCYECYVSDEPIATVFLSFRGERYTGEFGSFRLSVEDTPEFRAGVSDPELEAAREGILYDYSKGTNWSASDGWRGSYIGPDRIGSWVKVIDSWFGTVDGHFPDDDVANFHRRFEEEKADPEFPIIAAFPRTSNVCACGVEVYAPEDKKQEFKEWLEVRK